jgi:hypothetical protein
MGDCVCSLGWRGGQLKDSFRIFFAEELGKPAKGGPSVLRPATPTFWGGYFRLRDRRWTFGTFGLLDINLTHNTAPRPCLWPCPRPKSKAKPQKCVCHKVFHFKLAPGPKITSLDARCRARGPRTANPCGFQKIITPWNESLAAPPPLAPNAPFGDPLL